MDPLQPAYLLSHSTTKTFIDSCQSVSQKEIENLTSAIKNLGKEKLVQEAGPSLSLLDRKISQVRYTFGKPIPQDTPLGPYDNIEEIKDSTQPPINDLKKKYLSSLSQDLAYKPKEVIDSFHFYSKTLGYTCINQQMRTGKCKEMDCSGHIKNMLTHLNTCGFPDPVRLFRTEDSNYKQKVNGKLISSKELKVGDQWQFSSFISTSVTNQPERMKCQIGEDWTIFVFEFEINQDIKGLYLGETGVEGEAEYLLAPGLATVKDSYPLKIAVGYMVKQVTFVVCRLLFPSSLLEVNNFNTII